MSKVDGIMTGFGVIGVLIYFGVICFFIISTIVGIIAAFGAAWWMGLLAFIPPLGLINGIVYIGTWGGVNLAAKLVALIIGTKAAALLLAPSAV
jgi:hypothetical protein